MKIGQRIISSMNILMGNDLDIACHMLGNSHNTTTP